MFDNERARLCNAALMWDIVFSSRRWWASAKLSSSAARAQKLSQPCNLALATLLRASTRSNRS